MEKIQTPSDSGAGGLPGIPPKLQRLAALVDEALVANPAPEFGTDADRGEILAHLAASTPAWLQVEAFGDVVELARKSAQLRAEVEGLLGELRPVLALYLEASEIHRGHLAAVGIGEGNGPAEMIAGATGWDAAWGLVREVGDIVGEVVEW